MTASRNRLLFTGDVIPQSGGKIITLLLNDADFSSKPCREKSAPLAKSSTLFFKSATNVNSATGISTRLTRLRPKSQIKKLKIKDIKLFYSG